MTILYESWLSKNPEMAKNNNRWKHFIDAHPEIKDQPSIRWKEFCEYQRIHFPELWKIQSAKQPIKFAQIESSKGDRKGR